MGSNKTLRIYDIRSESSSTPKALTSTRAVYGVCVDGFMSTRIASHVDNQVVIWDTRNFDKPIVTHSQSRKVTKLQWSPTRSGLLCSITDNTSSLLLHDIQSWAVMSEDGEPAVTERSITLSSNNNSLNGEIISSENDDPDFKQQGMISSFAWHPNIENNLVAITNAGRLSETIVSERMAPSWSCQSHLSWPHGGILKCFGKDSQLYTEVQDISLTMQQRAAKGNNYHFPIL